MGKNSEGWPEVSEDHIKNIQKKEYIQEKVRGTICMALFTFTLH